MSIYDVVNVSDLLSSNSYPGRGIIVGKSENGNNAVFAYFIMGRSENSRNRVFVEGDDCMTIYPFDESKVEDPSLIIYSPFRKYENKYIVTNGDQTDTVFEGLEKGLDFEVSLRSRCFEPDAPNLTPRISSIIYLKNNDFTYKMSILKSADAVGSASNRYTFEYEPLKGLGHFIHTYNHDGNPIPTFTGEPKRVNVPNDIDEFSHQIWDNLDATNKVSMYVVYIDLKTGNKVSRVVNKNA